MCSIKPLVHLVANYPPPPKNHDFVLELKYFNNYITLEYNTKILYEYKYLVSQAAACDGTRITTTTNEQEAVPGTLPTF